MAGIPVNHNVDALIIAGAEDSAFAAGTDMSQFRAFKAPKDAPDSEAQMEDVIQALERCPIPIISAITGACAGAGTVIAAASDFRICDKGMRFGFPMARTLGNCSLVRNLNRLVARVGYSLVEEMVIGARFIRAKEAARIGLVAESCSSGQSVRDRSVELAIELKTHAPVTMKAGLEVLRLLRDEGPEAEDADLIEECYMSNDFEPRVEAFLSKMNLSGRAPNFKPGELAVCAGSLDGHRK